MSSKNRGSIGRHIDGRNDHIISSASRRLRICCCGTSTYCLSTRRGNHNEIYAWICSICGSDGDCSTGDSKQDTSRQHGAFSNRGRHASATRNCAPTEYAVATTHALDEYIHVLLKDDALCIIDTLALVRY